MLTTTPNSISSRSDDTLVSMPELQTNSVTHSSSLRTDPCTELETSRNLQRACNSLSTGLPNVAGSFGMMFNVRAKDSTIHITGLEFYTDLNAAHGRVAYILYSKTGSFLNAQDDLSRWTRETSGIVVGNGIGEATPIPRELDLTISEGTIRAIYITLVTSDIRHEYGKAPSPDQLVVQENEDIELREGIATLAWPLLPGNYTTTPRRFLGTIHYKRDRRGCSNIFDLENPSSKITTLVEYKFQIAHFNRIGRSQFVDVSNDAVEGFIRSAMNNGMQLRPLVQEHDIELQDVSSYYLRAADNAPTCIITDTISMCSIVSTFLKLTHDASISSIDARQHFLDYAEDVMATLPFAGNTIGPVAFTSDLIFLRLEGVTRLMNDDEIDCFQQILKRHVFPRLSDYLVTTIEIEVTDQEFISNERKLWPPEGGLRHRRRQLNEKSGAAFHEVSFDIKGEFLPPISADIEKVLNSAIYEEGYPLLNAFQASDGICEYFKDVSAIPGVNTTKPLEPVIPVQLEPDGNETASGTDISISVDDSADVKDALDVNNDSNKVGIVVGIVLFLIVVCVILGYFLSDREIRAEYTRKALKHRTIRKLVVKKRKMFRNDKSASHRSKNPDSGPSRINTSRSKRGHQHAHYDSDSEDDHPSKLNRSRSRRDSNNRSSDDSTESYDPQTDHTYQRSKSDSIVDRKNRSMSRSRSKREGRHQATREGSDPKMDVMEGRSSHARLERFTDEPDDPEPVPCNKQSSRITKKNLNSSDGTDRGTRRHDSMARSNSSRRHLSREGSDPKMDLIKGQSSHARLEGPNRHGRHSKEAIDSIKVRSSHERRSSNDGGRDLDVEDSPRSKGRSMRRSEQGMYVEESANREVRNGERIVRNHSMRGSRQRPSLGESNMGRSSHGRLERQNSRDGQPRGERHHSMDHQRMSKSHSMRASRKGSLDSSMSKRGSTNNGADREPAVRRGSHSSLNRSASRRGSASSELEGRNLNGSASRRGSASSDVKERNLNRSTSRRGSDPPSNWMDFDPDLLEYESSLNSGSGHQSDTVDNIGDSQHNNHQRSRTRGNRTQGRRNDSPHKKQAAHIRDQEVLRRSSTNMRDPEGDDHHRHHRRRNNFGSTRDRDCEDMDARDHSVLRRGNMSSRGSKDNESRSHAFHEKSTHKRSSKVSQNGGHRK